MGSGPGGWTRGLLVSLLVATAGCQSVSLPPAGTGSGTLELAEDERRLWNRAKEEQERLDGSGLLYEDRVLVDYVTSVARRLLPERARQAGLGIEVRIVRNPALNAFAFPHGVIYLHTGILGRMDNEAQLATLVAHELSHVTHRHTVRQFRDVQNKTAFFATLQTVAAPFGVYGLGVSLLGALGTLAAISGYSQELESDADREGLAVMVAAGYDPQEAPKLFLHLREWAAEEKKPEPFFFNTHPRLSERVENYERLLEGEFRALAEGHPRKIGAEEFSVRTRLLVFDNAVLDLQGGRFLQAQKGLRKFLALNPDDPRAYYYLAETYRRQNDPALRPEAIRLHQTAIALDGAFADPYRSLGTLYYQEGKKADAVSAFERYLELAPAAADRGYVQGLLEELRK